MNTKKDEKIAKATTSKRREKRRWPNGIHMIFLELCMDELEKGNKPGTYFTRTGYDNLLKNMKERTGITFEQKQLKNHFDSMKKDWKLYDRLMRIESGIGWDPIKKTIKATDEWWDEKIKADGDLAKFRNENLEMYKMYYTPLFQDSVAVGDRTKTPYEFENDTSEDDEASGDRTKTPYVNVQDIEGSGDSDELDICDGQGPMFPESNSGPMFPESSSSKRKKAANITTRSTKGKAAVVSAFEERLDTMLQALSSKSSQTFPPQNISPSAQDCMSIVTCFPGFEEGSQMYCHALRIFLSKQVRENFMVPKTDEGKMAFLKLLMEE